MQRSAGFSAKNKKIRPVSVCSTPKGRFKMLKDHVAAGAKVILMDFLEDRSNWYLTSLDKVDPRVWN